MRNIWYIEKKNIANKETSDVTNEIAKLREVFKTPNRKNIYAFTYIEKNYIIND